MTERPLGIGVVGLGWVAGAHIEAFSGIAGARVVAVCSRRAHDPTELARRYGVQPRIYSDLPAMLADPDVDVVDICTPHPLHPEQAIAAARAGKHLIVEKPIALTLEDARRMREEIRAAGVQACVCFEVRFSAHFRMVKSLLDQGLLGDVHYGEIDYFHGIGPWYGQYEWNVKKDFGGSSLLTAGCHAMDALLLCLGDDVEEVTSYQTRSKSRSFAPYEYPTTTTTILRFASGKVGKCASVVDCLQPYYFHCHLVGSEGSLLDDRFYSEKLDGLDRGRWSRLATHPVDSGDVGDHPYRPQFEAFVASVREGRPMPLTDFETAYRSHEVVFAADRSWREGRPVRLSEPA